MARSIPSPHVPPVYLLGIFTLLLPHGGAFPKVGPGVGHCQKQLSPSDFKSSMVPLQHVQIFAQLFYLRTWDDRRKNVHGTWKSCSFSCWKAIWAITDPMKIHFFVSDYCFLVLRVGHLHSFRSPTVGHLYALVGPAVGHLPQFWNQKTNAQWMIKVIRDTALNTGNMGISKQGQATRSRC